MIATGVRPRSHESLPQLKEWAITSDDLFSLKEAPGKTLVIGGGYIAIECAGFLRSLNTEVILANRSSFLRVFDHDMAAKVENQLEEEGIRLLKNTTILSVIKLEDKLFEVTLQIGKTTETLQVNTLLMAIGRDPNPEAFGAQKAGLALD